MNLMTFPLLCLTILLQQTICQDEPISKYSCDNDDVKQFIVSHHNELRSKVTPPPSNMLQMEWNDEAAENAAKWSKTCANAHSKANAREVTNFGCGENLYMSNRVHSWKKVIKGWWDEHKDFTYGEGATDSNAIIGHYTQLVWYKSWQLGCAVNYCPEKELCYFYVCHYCPAGNVKNSINSPYATGDMCSNCTHACHNGLCTNPCPHDDDFDECPQYKELCNSEEEDVSEEHKIKNICKETCNCNDEII